MWRDLESYQAHHPSIGYGMGVGLRIVFRVGCWSTYWLFYYFIGPHTSIPGICGCSTTGRLTLEPSCRLIYHLRKLLLLLRREDRSSSAAWFRFFRRDTCLQYWCDLTSVCVATPCFFTVYYAPLNLCRRMVNLTYVLWVSAHSSLMLSLLMLFDIIRWVSAIILVLKRI